MLDPIENLGCQSAQNKLTIGKDVTFERLSVNHSDVLGKNQ